jgi:hypothetical protein
MRWRTPGQVFYSAGGNEWFGPAIWKSTDLGASWTSRTERVRRPIKTAWSLGVGHGAIYAGVEPAGLSVRTRADYMPEGMRYLNMASAHIVSR